MSNAQSYGQPKPYAFDPVAEPEYYEGVLGRRFVAFLIDAVLICAPIGAAAVFILVFGFLTLGLGWFLFSLLSPAFIIWALAYTGLTLGGGRSATMGMRAMGIEMRQSNGAPMYALLALASVVLFWIFASVLTPFVVIVGLFNSRKRLLHDLVLSTVVTNTAERAAGLRRYRR